MSGSVIYSRIAKCIYLIILIILIYPIWTVAFFHTGDGPAHLYCAIVLKSLLKDPSSCYSDFFSLSLMAVPNSFVQLLLALLMNVTSWAYSTKILLTVILLVFILGYISLVRSLTEEKNLYPVMITLLVFTYPLRMGFYSFILGVGVMMFVLTFYIKNVLSKKRNSIYVFSLLLLFTWFCHLFAFATLLLFVFFIELSEGISSIRNKQSVKKILKRKILILLAFLPVFLLSYIYIRIANQYTPTKYVDINVLKKWLSDIIVMYNFGTEKEFIIRKIFYLLFFSALTLLFVQRSKLKSSTVVFLTGSMISLLLLYFILPANYFSGGSINLRIEYLALIILCIFIDIVIIGNIQIILKLMLTGIAVCFASINEIEMLKPASNNIAEVISAASYIKDESLVLPLNYGNDNFQYNILLYLACKKNVVVLDNAEAITPNSLVRWKSNIWRPELIGNYLNTSVPEIHPWIYEMQLDRNIDYIVLWGLNKSNAKKAIETTEYINNKYQLTYQSLIVNLKVYQKK